MGSTFFFFSGGTVWVSPSFRLGMEPETGREEGQTTLDRWGIPAQHLVFHTVATVLPAHASI